MKRLLYVLTICMAIALGLSFFCQPARSQAFPPSWYSADKLVQYHGPDLGSSKEAGVELYVKPKIDPVPQPAPDPDPAPAPPREVDRRKADAKQYPSLYSKARQKGVIVVFGNPWCGFCRWQTRVIPDNYRILYVDVENKTGPDWRKLMTKWEVITTKVLGKEIPTYPTVVVAVDGIPVDSWTGFKPFRAIEKRIQKAKKDEENNKAGIRRDGNGGWHRGNGGGRRPSTRRRRPTRNRGPIARFIFG